MLVTASNTQLLDSILNKPKMEEIKVYVYGLLDNKGKVYYIGRTTTPKDRLIHHNVPVGVKKRMIILDEYIDKEHYWIQYYTQKGYDLLNKEYLSSESWNVGDVIEVKTGRVGRPKRS